MVSDLGGVILIVFVITAELGASYQQTLKVQFVIFFLTTVVFIPDARPVFSGNMGGTAPSCLKPSATRRGMIFQCNFIVIIYAVYCGCYECVMNVLWMCDEYVMNVFWMCHGCVMNVLWMCYGCVRDVLWMCEGCYGCIGDCYGCVKDVCVMDEWWIFYIYRVSCIVNGIVIVIL